MVWWWLMVARCVLCCAVHFPCHCRINYARNSLRSKRCIFKGARVRLQFDRLIHSDPWYYYDSYVDAETTKKLEYFHTSVMRMDLIVLDYPPLATTSWNCHWPVAAMQRHTVRRMRRKSPSIRYECMYIVVNGFVSQQILFNFFFSVAFAVS